MSISILCTLCSAIDINGQDEIGSTALHLACEKRNVDLVRPLLKYRAGKGGREGREGGRGAMEGRREGVWEGGREEGREGGRERS